MNPLTALLTGLLVGLPFATGKVLAAEWDKAAGLSVGSEFSDNICLSSGDKSSRSFATVTPDIRVRGRGARANIGLEGRVRYNTLAESDFSCSEGQRPLFANREAFMPSLRYYGDLELVDDWLTLESDASARTTNIDPFAPGDASGFDGRDNVNIVYQYGAGALIQRRLFNTADMRLRYNYNEQANGVRLLGDSSESRGEFDLGTERANNRLTLGVSGRYSEVAYDGTTLVPAFDNKLSSAEARASLRLSSSWQISAMSGEEWNEFVSARRGIDGSYWDASLSWSPNDRIEVDVGTGERFFGSTPRMSIRYRHKRSELSATYNRSLTLPRDLRAAGRNFDDPFDDFFDPDFDAGENTVPGQLPGFPSVVNGEPTFIGNAPLINEQLRLNYRYSARRTTVSITASNSRQRRLEDLDQATFSNVGFRLSRSLSSTLSANLNVSFSEREGRGNNNLSAFSAPSENWRAAFGFNRRLSRDTTISMNYQYNRRESDAALNNYTENRIVLSARHQF